MTARRKKRHLKTQKSKISFTRKHIMIFLILILTTTVSFAGIFTIINNSIKQNRFSIAELKNQEYSIYVYDFKANIITRVVFPKNVYVNAALGRGNWRLESVNRMIDSEGLGNQVYADTLMKTFNVPIDAWTVNNSSSMNVLQRFKLMMTRFNSKVLTLDLQDSNYLTLKQLPDGEEGFVVNDDLPTNIKQAFADFDFASNGYRVEVERYIDKNYSSASDLIEVLTTMGAHVVNLKREDSQEIHCLIEAKEDVEIERLSKMFGCKNSVISEGNLDIRIKLGNLFASRF